MIGQTNGAQGGSGTLLKIKNYSELPATGKYGNVAVITDTAIKYWEVGQTEPTTRSDGSALQAGDVFIQLGTSSQLNVLRKNAIWISLDNCKQYSGSEWVNTAAYYYGTAWNKFSDVMVYLMKDGVFSSDYTFKSASGTWETDPYAVFDPYSLNWVWAYNAAGYRQKSYDDSIRWLKMTSLFHVGSFKKLYIRYSLSTSSGVCQFGYNVQTSTGSSVTDFVITPKYITLTGTGIDNVLTSYIDIEPAHLDITPFIHVYNENMRVYDIWLA